MPKSKVEIIGDIEGFVFKHGGLFKDWYVGAAAVPRDILFNQHNFIAKRDIGLIRTAENSDEARQVVAFFVNSLNTRGEPERVARGDVHVYAFRRTAHTTP